MAGWIILIVIGVIMGGLAARLHRHQNQHHYIWPDHTGKIHIPPDIGRHPEP